RFPRRPHLPPSRARPAAPRNTRPAGRPARGPGGGPAPGADGQGARDLRGTEAARPLTARQGRLIVTGLGFWRRKSLMKNRGFLSLAIGLGVLGLASSALAQGSKRHSVAVMDFDFGTVHEHWWGDYDIGKGMADQVVDALVNDGTFRVIERKKL